MPFIGEAIALTTVLCWTFSVQFFAAASKEVGATPVNIIRLFVALLLFTALLLFRQGALFPVDFPLRAWFMLSLSGVIGFFIGDIFLFKALVELGPRITMLIQSLAAPTAAVFGWSFLHESYNQQQWLGMAVTLAGVCAVILEKSRDAAPARKLQVARVSFRGVAFAFAAMLGQAGGLLLSKSGMQTDAGYLDAFSATQIRALAAFCCFVLYFTVTGRWQNVGAALTNRKAVAFTAIGAAIGPFIGVSMSLMALHYLPTGVASTFFSLIPICIIPFSIYLQKEHVSLRAIAGAVVAVFGVYLLMV
ncbi:DMT family transporter [Desulfopila sp. IMCC35006]|uniref:DMT family transporter n=1 Tax=Desulfopila sp. IMCC35006 TaxID=2569542 RepID=UPI0010AC384B|nr:DMT family transporter [Desulfopila sp. IMCC35006]TKB27057.1 DMT family transporter [Desulfopila sp. IMCC35006]